MKRLVVIETHTGSYVVTEQAEAKSVITVRPGGGAPGEPGADGTPGNIWYFSRGNPDYDVGNYGDCWLNTETFQLFAKIVNSQWYSLGFIKGDPGDPGAAAPIYERRYDISGNYIYAGTATDGSAESDAVWTIRRLTYVSGAYVTTQQAPNVTWTGRAGHTYT